MASQKPNKNTLSYWLTKADGDEESGGDGESHASSSEDEDFPPKNTVSYWLFKADSKGKKAGTGIKVPEVLTFHPTRRSKVVFSNDLRTATSTESTHLSWASTSRVLQSKEHFSIILDEYDPKFFFYFGVRINLPSNGSRYWQMKVAKDSISLVKEDVPDRDYVSYPYPPQVGYRYSVVRKSNGDLRFEVNGRKLGVAFTNVPEEVYGYVDFQRGTKFTID